MNKKNLMLDRRQALGLAAGMFGVSALATLAGCSDGPSEPASNGGSDAAQTSSTDIDKDAFDKLVATVEPADDATIDANACGKAIKEAGTFRLGATRTSVLFSQLDETTGKVYGFDAAIYLSLVRYILGDETKYDYTQMTSDTRESVLQNDNVDAVFATYSINEKRKEVISFAGPYFTTQQGILVAADNQDINGLDDLKGKKVAVQSGSTGPQVVEEFAPEAELQEFSKDDECRAALEQGRVDAYVVDMTLHMGNVVKNPGKYRIAGDAFGPEDKYGIGLKLGSDGVDFVNAFLEKFEKDGKWADFYKICIADRTGVSTVPEPPAIGA